MTPVVHSMLYVLIFQMFLTSLSVICSCINEARLDSLMFMLAGFTVTQSTQNLGFAFLVFSPCLFK
jgi:hypothetical protein